MKNIIAVFFSLFLFFQVKAQLTCSFNVTPYCNELSSGSVCVNVTGGTAPYFYVWSNGLTVQCFGGSLIQYPGIYSVTVVDANGLDVTGNFSTNNYQYEVNSTINITNENCSDGNGSATLNLSGGTLPYTVEWLDGYFQPYRNNNLSQGVYFYKVTDANGCYAFDTTFPYLNYDLPDSFPYLPYIIDRNVPFEYVTLFTNHNCPTLGTATITVTNSITPVTYTWNTIPQQTTASVNNLFAGNYTVTISDASPGCSVTETFLIQNLNPLNFFTTSTNELCDYNNGTATIIPQSGIPPYQYSWNTNPPQTTSTARNLSNGVYQFTFSDANNCSGNNSVFVSYSSPVILNAVEQNEICNNNQGSVSLTPQLGTPPYTYSWSNGNTTSSINNLSQGSYSFTVNDAEGCSVTGSQYVNDVPSFNAQINAQPQTCLALGSATASVNGTTGPFSFRWNTNPVQTSATINNLNSGNYFCTVTDVNNCSAVKSIFIPFDPLVSASLNSNSALCLTASGSTTLNVSRGLAPFAYLWSNGNTTQNINNVVSGSYTVTITDANNCSISKSVFVNSYSNLNMTIQTNNATCIFTNDGSASLGSTNAASPITYQWNNGATTSSISGLSPASCYALRIVDGNGCTAGSLFSIEYNNLSCAAIINGKVIYDVDTDCNFTPGDEGINQIPISVVPGYYDMTDINGNYEVLVPQANYAVNHTPKYHMFPLCPDGSVELFPALAGTDTTINFYDTVRTALDVSVGYGFLTPPRPGFNNIVRVTYKNEGNINVSPTIEFEYDDDVEYSNVFNSNFNSINVDVVNRKVIIECFNLSPNEMYFVDLEFYTPDTVALGTNVVHCATIYPVQNDVNFINNTYCDSTLVVGSYDPNDKLVTPKGRSQQGYIDSTETLLHYTIRFQNTGTYFAENVFIIDTLDFNVLNPATIERVIASHNVKVDFLQNKYLIFYFNNIFLADSFSNEKESHGFVSFFIKLNDSLPLGSVIKNRAAIYFDFNPPIITNYTTNTIFDPLNNVMERNNSKEVKVLAYPNPANNIVQFTIADNNQEIIKVELYDLNGKKSALKNDNWIDIQSLSKGMYFYKATTNKNIIVSGKIVKQ